MDTKSMMQGCACCAVDRRGFLAAGCAACAGVVSTLRAPARAYAAESGKPFTVRVIYSLHAEVQPGPDWPNVGFDFRPVMERTLAALQGNCPSFKFVSSTATGPEEAEALLKQDQSGGVDGYIVYQMNCWNRVIQSVAKTGKPALYVDFQFGGSGGFLVYNAAFLRQKTANVGFVASSRTEDLIAAVQCFDVVRKGGSTADFVLATERARIAGTPQPAELDCKPDTVQALSPQEFVERSKTLKLLAVRDEKSGQEEPIMGIAIDKIPFAELNDAWKASNKEETMAVADRWEKTAAAVTGVPRETLEQSAAMYLAMKEILKRHGAQGITVNCLGGFYGGHIHAYPCLGFHELCNEGLVGACEADTRSAATMLAFGTLSQGRPGYISDPVMDSSKRQIVYAHCVGSNRVFGPAGETNPFEIMTHSEDRQGASVRSIMPLGYMTTTLELSQERKEILFHRGKAVANDPDDRACRTKLAAEPVGDFEKLFTQWDPWGWHRVTFYGDLKEPVFALADAIGWKVVEEA